MKLTARFIKSGSSYSRALLELGLCALNNNVAKYFSKKAGNVHQSVLQAPKCASCSTISCLDAMQANFEDITDPDNWGGYSTWGNLFRTLAALSEKASQEISANPSPVFACKRTSELLESLVDTIYESGLTVCSKFTTGMNAQLIMSILNQDIITEIFNSAPKYSKHA